MLLPIDVTMTNYDDGPNSELLLVVEIGQIFNNKASNNASSKVLWTRTMQIGAFLY